MRKEYEEKLQLMKDEMEKAEVFAEKLPFFSTLILDNIINGSGVLRMGGRRNPFVNQAVWRKSIDAELGNGIAYGRILQ